MCFSMPLQDSEQGLEATLVQQSGKRQHYGSVRVWLGRSNGWSLPLLVQEAAQVQLWHNRSWLVEVLERKHVQARGSGSQCSERHYSPITAVQTSFLARSHMQCRGFLRPTHRKG